MYIQKSTISSFISVKKWFDVWNPGLILGPDRRFKKYPNHWLPMLRHFRDFHSFFFPHKMADIAEECAVTDSKPISTIVIIIGITAVSPMVSFLHTPFPFFCCLCVYLFFCVSDFSNAVRSSPTCQHIQALGRHRFTVVFFIIPLIWFDLIWSVVE